MSAELLREAAALMRERAMAATPGPWDALRTPRLTRFEVRSETYTVATLPFTEDAEHIASWHPAVALAVADWLDYESQFCADPDDADVMLPQALAVARTYLGRDA